MSATTPAQRLDPGVLIALLQQAAVEQTSVVMGYVDPAGVATQRVVAPINIRGGQLTAFDPAAGPGAGVRDPSRDIRGVGRLWIMGPMTFQREAKRDRA